MPSRRAVIALTKTFGPPYGGLMDVNTGVAARTSIDR